MQNASLWRTVLGVENTVVEDIEFNDDAQAIVAHVRPARASSGRCGACGSRASWYDRGQGRRQWRGLDVGTVQVYLEADAPRVGAASTGRPSARSRGLVMVPDTPVHSISRSHGWPLSARRRQSPS